MRTKSTYYVEKIINAAHNKLNYFLSFYASCFFKNTDSCLRVYRWMVTFLGGAMPLYEKNGAGSLWKKTDWERLASDLQRELSKKDKLQNLFNVYSVNLNDLFKGSDKCIHAQMIYLLMETVYKGRRIKLHELYLMFESCIRKKFSVQQKEGINASIDNHSDNPELAQDLKALFNAIELYGEEDIKVGEKTLRLSDFNDQLTRDELIKVVFNIDRYNAAKKEYDYLHSLIVINPIAEKESSPTYKLRGWSPLDDYGPIESYTGDGRIRFQHELIDCNARLDSVSEELKKIDAFLDLDVANVKCSLNQFGSDRFDNDLMRYTQTINFACEKGMKLNQAHRFYEKSRETNQLGRYSFQKDKTPWSLDQDVACFMRGELLTVEELTSEIFEHIKYRLYGCSWSINSSKGSDKRRRVLRQIFGLEPGLRGNAPGVVREKIMFKLKEVNTDEGQARAFEQLLTENQDILLKGKRTKPLVNKIKQHIKNRCPKDTPTQSSAFGLGQ